MTPDKTPSEIESVMALVLQCTDARLAWDNEATGVNFAAWRKSLDDVRAVLAKWGSPVVAGEPYGCVTTHCMTGQQFFYRHPEPPYLDNASECVTVYAKEKHPRQSDQDHAQMAGYDASGAGAAGGPGADQHHEYRIGESDPQREESERDSGRIGLHGPCDVSQEVNEVRGWARAATPQPTQAQAGAVPQYRLLVRGQDTIQADDEFLREDGVTWRQDPSGIFVGCMYEGTILLPARRAIKEGGQHAAD